MSKFKSIYEFSIPRLEKAPEAVVIIDEQGNEIKGEKMVEKEVPYFFAIKRPSREITDRGELFYSATVGEGMAEGLMSRALVVKRYNNDGGVFSDEQKELLAEIQEEYRETELELFKCYSKVEAERNEEEKDKIKELEKAKFRLGRELQDFGIQQQTLLENTAEERARTKSINWYLLELLYIKEGSEYKPLFPANTGKDLKSIHKERLAVWDEILELAEDDEKEGSFYGQIFQKALQIVTIWYYRRVTKPDELDKIIKEIENPLLTENSKDEPTTS